MVLSIITLFCDKDYQYLETLLEKIDKTILCNKEIILVDNREKTKNENIEFIDKYNTVYIDMHGNAAQLASKQAALKKVSGDYVWFFDVDDEPYEILTQEEFDKYSSDVILFEYCDDGCNISVRFKKEEVIDDIKSKGLYNYNFFYTVFFVMCWNKFFKAELIKKNFIFDEEIKEKISNNEDTVISLFCFNNMKSLEINKKIIYKNLTERGLSSSSDKKNITYEDFKMLIQGKKIADSFLKKMLIDDYSFPYYIGTMVALNRIKNIKDNKEIIKCFNELKSAIGLNQINMDIKKTFAIFKYKKNGELNKANTIRCINHIKKAYEEEGLSIYE